MFDEFPVVLVERGSPMKKFTFCLVLLGLGAMTFAGCAEEKKPKPPTTPPAAGTDDPAPPADAPADKPADAPTTPPADAPADK